MDFEERLVQIIERAVSPTAALHAAAAAIAQDELSDACGVFLTGPEGTLTLWAHSGDGFEATRADVDSVAREALARISGASGEHGGHVMIAYVQQPNESFFRRLGWTRVGEPSLR